MKLVVSLFSSSVFVAGLLILAPEHVPFAVHTSLTVPVRPLARARITPVLYTHTLRGTPVSTEDGISLGVLDDLVFDPTDGRILMVIVVASGRFGLSARFIALPWSLIQPVPNGPAFVVVPRPRAALRFSPTREGLEEVLD